MQRNLLCIICGTSRNDVDGMFCFPRNAERSRLWQEKLDMVYQPTLSNHIRVCSKHFDESAFRTDLYGGKSLKRDSIPKPWPVKSVVFTQTETPATSTNDDSCDNFNMDDPPETASTSDNVEPFVPEQPQSCDKRTLKKHEQSVLKEMKKTATGREKYLLNIIRKREEHIKKLKWLSRSRGKFLKKFFYFREQYFKRHSLS